MILDEKTGIKVETSGNDFESFDAGIDFNNIGFMFDIVSKQMYKDPMGSIVREITSNGYDSHIEAGSTYPVIINREIDEDGISISFEDFGKGMSYRRLKKIFSNYFSSTKRDSNAQIGGFGIGSKSPLAYTEIFYIRSRFRGIEYDCMYHKGETKPKLEILSENKTTERNGVKITIPIKSFNQYRKFDTTTDDGKFQEKIRIQLAYFDGVYIDNWGVRNDYKIYNGRTFKFRDDIPTDIGMHICLGKVYYPIDWKEIGMSPCYIPIAVKFEIGELMVTPNRESIRYSDESKELIKQRIESVFEEIREIYSKQIPEEDNYFIWLKKSRLEPHIMLGDKFLGITGVPGVDNSIQFKPFKELGLDVNLKSINSRPLLEYSCLETIVDREGNIKERIYSRNIVEETIPYHIGIIVDGPTNKETNAKLFSLFGETHLIRYKKAELKDLFSYLKLSKSIGTFGNGGAFYPGYSQKIPKFRKIIRQELVDKLELKTEGSCFYEDYKPDAEWVKEWKKSIVESTEAFKRKQRQAILIKYVENNSREQEVKVVDLEKSTTLIIYGSRKDVNKLNMVSDLISCRKSIGEFTSGYRLKIDRKRVSIIQTSMQNFKLFNDSEHACHVDEFFSNNKLFKEVITAFKVREVLDKIPNVDAYKNISPFLYERLKRLLEVKEKYHWAVETQLTRRMLSSYTDEMKGYSKMFLSFIDSDVRNDIQVINEYFRDIEYIKYIPLNNETTPLVVKALIKNKRKVSPHWIHNPTNKTTYSRQLEFGVTKTNYYGVPVEVGFLQSTFKTS